MFNTEEDMIFDSCTVCIALKGRTRTISLSIIHREFKESPEGHSKHFKDSFLSKEMCCYKLLLQITFGKSLDPLYLATFCLVQIHCKEHKIHAKPCQV